jgi:hypothetical protein
VAAPERDPVSLADIEIFSSEKKEAEPEPSRWPLNAPPDAIDTMEAARECYETWATLTHKALDGGGMTSDQQRKLVGALRRFSVHKVKLALAWGALSHWHRENGADTVETLLYSAAKVESNATQALERIGAHVASLRGRIDGLRQEGEALAMVAANQPSTPAKIERLTRAAQSLEVTANTLAGLERHARQAAASDALQATG